MQYFSVINVAMWFRYVKIDSIFIEAMNPSQDELLLEKNRQSTNDLTALKLYNNLFENASGSDLQKLDTFSRFVRRQRISKFIAHYEIYKKILDVSGSIVEVGVHAAQSLFTFGHLSSILEPYNYTRKIIGFDTFCGFSEISDNDISPSTSSNVKLGGFIYEDFESIEKAIHAFDMNRPLGHIPKIFLNKGRVEDTAIPFLETNPHILVSMLHLDVDLYEPTLHSLNTFLPRMSKGSIIIFDEVNQEGYPGETLALLKSNLLNTYKLERFSFEPGLSYIQLN